MADKEETPIEKLSDRIEEVIEDAAEAVTGHSSSTQNVIINNYGPVVGAKSVGVAYALWFFLGGFGAHKFYLRKTAVAIVYLALYLLMFIISFASAFLLGWIAGVPLMILLFIDVFTIPNQVRKFNASNALGK